MKYWFLWVGISFSVYAQNTVFVLSVDGLAADYLHQHQLGTFEKIKKEGSYAKRLETVFPSLTFPNHVSLATGCTPGKHGIVANRFRDQKRGYFSYEDDPSWMECEPLWVAAERQGIKSAVYQWPMSFGKWNGKEASYHLNSFDSKRRDWHALDQLVAWVRLPKKKRPRLLMTYLHGVDHNGHEYGPSSPQVAQQLKKFDRMLGSFLEEVEKNSDLGSFVVLVVSDHGMLKVEGILSTKKLFSKYKIQSKSVISGPIMYLYTQEEKKIAKNLDSEKNIQAFTRDSFPKRFGKMHARMGNVVGLAQAPFVFEKLSGRRDVPKGTHGFDPSHPAMDGVVLFYGPGIAQGKTWDRLRVLDIASVVSHLLEMEPPKDQEGQLPKSFGLKTSKTKPVEPWWKFWL